MHAIGVHAWWCTGGQPALVYPGRVPEEMPGNGHRRYPENCQNWPFRPVVACSDLCMGETQGFDTSVSNMTMYWRRPTADDCLKTARMAV